MSLFGWLTQPGLRARVRALEKRLEEVDYEWADWYQKFRTLHARLAKQVKRADAAREEPDDGGADGPGGEMPSGAGPAREPAPGTAIYRRLRGF